MNKLNDILAYLNHEQTATNAVYVIGFTLFCGRTQSTLDDPIFIMGCGSGVGTIYVASFFALKHIIPTKYYFMFTILATLSCGYCLIKNLYRITKK